MMNYLQTLTKAGFFIKKFEKPQCVEILKSIVLRYFPEDSNNLAMLTKLHREDFHQRVLECQDEINALDFQRMVYNSESAIFDQIFEGENYLRERMCFLRAVRPHNGVEFDEALGLHRETMYCEFPEQLRRVVNIWIPILNVSNTTSMCFIPNSHLLNDSDLIIESAEQDPHITKGSSGHKVGFLYAPKKIMSGIDKKTLTRFDIPFGSYVAFSALLVHGGGSNYSQRIRFSMSMSMIPESDIVENPSKIVSSGQSHYTSF